MSDAQVWMLIAAIYSGSRTLQLRHDPWEPRTAAILVDYGLMEIANGRYAYLTDAGMQYAAACAQLVEEDRGFTRQWPGSWTD